MADFTTEETQIAAYSAKEVIDRCKEDFNFFCRVALPEVCVYDFPDFYVAVFWMLVEACGKERDDSKYAIGIPRAHAKTSYAKLLIVWLILFSKKRYFMIVGSIEKKAADIVADVISTLEQPNMVTLFGKWDADADRDSLTDKKFRFRGKTIMLAAVGPTGGAVRGTNKDFKRPDFVLMDDIITDLDAKSPTVSSERFTWLLGTLIPAGDSNNCQYLYLGNKYEGDGCILSKLEKISTWTSLVVGCILSDGQPLWPERFSLEMLQGKLREGIEAHRPEIFFAEWMNYVGDLNRTGFNYAGVEVIEDETEYAPDANWLIIDPSAGVANSDNQAVGWLQSWNGKPHINDLTIWEGTAPGLVYWCIPYCIENRIPIVFIEGDGYQVTLCQWFEKVMQEQGVEGITIVPISVNKRNKATRILAGLKVLGSGGLTIAPRVRSRLFAEIRNYNPLVINNVDDMLDIVAHGSESLIKYPGEILSAQHYFGDAVNVTGPDSGELIEESIL